MQNDRTQIASDKDHITVLHTSLFHEFLNLLRIIRILLVFFLLKHAQETKYCQYALYCENEDAVNEVPLNLILREYLVLEFFFVIYPLNL